MVRVGESSEQKRNYVRYRVRLIVREITYPATPRSCLSGKLTAITVYKCWFPLDRGNASIRDIHEQRSALKNKFTTVAQSSFSPFRVPVSKLITLEK